MGSLRRFSARRVAAFVLIDWLGTLALLYLVYWLGQFAGRSSPTGPWQPASSTVTGVSAAPSLPLFPVGLFVAVAWPTGLLAFSVYDGRRNGTLRAELSHVGLAIAVATMTLAGVLYLTGWAFPRAMLLGFFALDAALLLGSRVLLWAARRIPAGRKRSRRRNVLIVGAGPVGQNVARQLGRYGWSNLDIAGYVDDDPAKRGRLLAGRPVLGTLDQAPALAAALGIQDAVVALPLRAHDRLAGICRRLQQCGIHAHVVPDLFALSFPNAALDGFGGIPVVTLGLPAISAQQRFWKRVFDSVIAAVMLAILSPLILAIALLIKLDSPGPVIYKQERVGENGRPFTMYKFRSMRHGADTSLHRAHVTELIERNLKPEQLDGNGKGSLKKARDPRVTRVGRIIRKASLDELPQLVNVLRGDMSLVGPRPPLPYEVAVYKDWHKRRLEALPGITGPWQVEGRNTVSFDEMVRLDLKYIENQSLRQDIKILLQTPWAVLTGRGAG